ncbi:MAG: hypothetical protein AB7Q17_13695 [Phycisphaerae bacterium]
MNHHHWNTLVRLGLWAAVLALGSAALAQPAPERAHPGQPREERGATPAVDEQREDTTPPATAEATGDEDTATRPAPFGAARRPAAPEIPVVERSVLDRIAISRPELPATHWFAIIVILVLTLTSRPLLSQRSVDGLVLALVCLLLPNRDNEQPLFREYPTQTIVYALLTLSAVYWVIRGVQLLRATAVPRGECNVTEAPLLVLTIAGMALAFSSLADAPVTDDSRDALVGGVYFAETGRLPYGETTGYDAHAPLTYAVHAGAAKLMPPQVEADGALVPISWERRGAWDVENWWQLNAQPAVRLVNAVVYLLTLFGLVTFGRRVHSPGMGLTVGALFSVFPGVIECLPHPDIMIPTMMLVWTLVLATLPGVAGLLATLFLVLTGLAWPWAWLALPVLMVYFARQGAQGAGSVLGFLAGGAVVAGMVFALVRPAPPRSDGALLAAGEAPRHTATMQSDGSVRIERAATLDTAARDFKSGLWRFLLSRDGGALLSDDAGKPRVVFGEGVTSTDVAFRTLHTSPEARQALLPRYRAADGGFIGRLRTLLEATWLPARDAAPPAISAWSVWAGDTAEGVERQVMARRITKLVVAVVGLLLALMMRSVVAPRSYHLVGALLALSAAILIASPSGAATNWVWLVVAIGAALAAWGDTPVAAAARPNAPAAGRLGAAPRISAE